jgi:hypothetical protein
MFDHRSRIACLTLAGTLLAGMGGAWAQDSQNDCPGLTDVTTRLDQLLVDSMDTGRATKTMVIRDLGASWEIEVAGHRASYADPVRDCAERVRVATVFAALALEPPDRAAPAEVVALASEPRLPRSSMQQGLELAPAIVLGLGAGDTTTAFGGVLRWWISGARMGLTAGLSGLLPAVVRAGAYEASLARVVLDVSPRVRLLAGSTSFTLELGPFAGLLFAKGRDLSPGGSSTNLDAGAHLAVRAEHAWRRLSPFVAVQGDLSVRSFRMSVEPTGDVGTTPGVWLGLLLGVALGL